MGSGRRLTRPGAAVGGGPCVEGRPGSLRPSASGGRRGPGHRAGRRPGRCRRRPGGTRGTCRPAGRRATRCRAGGACRGCRRWPPTAGRSPGSSPSPAAPPGRPGIPAADGRTRRPATARRRAPATGRGRPPTRTTPRSRARAGSPRRPWCGSSTAARDGRRRGYDLVPWLAPLPSMTTSATYEWMLVTPTQRVRQLTPAKETGPPVAKGVTPCSSPTTSLPGGHRRRPSPPPRSGLRRRMWPPHRGHGLPSPLGPPRAPIPMPGSSKWPRSGLGGLAAIVSARRPPANPPRRAGRYCRGHPARRRQAGPPLLRPESGAAPIQDFHERIQRAAPHRCGAEILVATGLLGLLASSWPPRRRIEPPAAHRTGRGRGAPTAVDARSGATGRYPVALRVGLPGPSRWPRSAASRPAGRARAPTGGPGSRTAEGRSTFPPLLSKAGSAGISSPSGCWPRGRSGRGARSRRSTGRHEVDGIGHQLHDADRPRGRNFYCAASPTLCHARTARPGRSARRPGRTGGRRRAQAGPVGGPGAIRGAVRAAASWAGGIRTTAPGAPGRGVSAPVAGSGPDGGGRVGGSRSGAGTDRPYPPAAGRGSRQMDAAPGAHVDRMAAIAPARSPRRTGWIRPAADPPATSPANVPIVIIFRHIGHKINSRNKVRSSATPPLRRNAYGGRSRSGGPRPGVRRRGARGRARGSGRRTASSRPPRGARPRRR